MPPRRDPLAHLKATPQGTVETIARAEKKSRDRGWEKNNRSFSYKIPPHLEVRAREIRDAIVALAESQIGMTSVDSVASAMLESALRQYDQGLFTLEVRHDPSRQRMRVIFTPANDGWPQEIPDRHERKSKGKRKALFLGYRWSSPVYHKRVSDIASHHNLANSEALIALLSYSVEAYKRGALRMETFPVTVRQNVAGSWT